MKGMVIIGRNGVCEFPASGLFVARSNAIQSSKNGYAIVPIRARLGNGIRHVNYMTNLLPFALYDSAERANEVIRDVCRAYAQGEQFYELPEE